MRDGIRKLFILGVFCATVAGVWTLGAVKADLDGPAKLEMQVDPSIVRAALLADPALDAETAQLEGTSTSYLFAS